MTNPYQDIMDTILKIENVRTVAPNQAIRIITWPDGQKMMITTIYEMLPPEKMPPKA